MNGTRGTPFEQGTIIVRIYPGEVRFTSRRNRRLDRVGVYSDDKDCHDYADILIDKSGRRLDDGPRERVLSRLGWRGVFLLMISDATAIYSKLRVRSIRRKESASPRPPLGPGLAFAQRWVLAVG